MSAVVLGADAAARFRVERDPLVEKIDAILPQTQCRRCGFPACKPYASAIAKGEADINQCPPGGEEGIRQLADLLGLEYKALSAEHGVEQPRSVAIIDEQACIGCTLCIQSCPVDAIIGAAKQMHTVIARECTGCELCLPPCPVDCISMQAVDESVDIRKRKKESADVARERYQFRLLREEREKQEHAAKLAAKTTARREKAGSAKTDAAQPAAAPEDARKALITAALERARIQQRQAQPANIDNLTPGQEAEVAAIEARRAEIRKMAKPQPEQDG